MKRIQFSLLGMACGALVLISCNMLQLLDGGMKGGQARPTVKVTATRIDAAQDRPQLEGRATPTWTASPGKETSSASGEIWLVSTIQPLSTVPRNEASTSGPNMSLNSPLPTPPNSPLPTPVPPTATPEPPMPTETFTMTPAPSHTPMPTITGTRTETPTPTPSHQPLTRTWTPTGNVTRSPTPSRTRMPDTPMWTNTPANPPPPTSTLPNSPLSTPTPTGTCCIDCEC